MSLLSTERIGLLDEAKDSIESIISAGNYLKQAGYVTDGYVQSMVNSFEQNGPYFALAPHFAMPHARPSDEVLKTGISLITLKNPVDFGNKNDPIKVIIALAAKSGEEHLIFMKKVASVLMQENIIERLYSCKSADEILAIVNQ
ncbi:MAG: PTS sugar transporter subunit IIA [Defluviitaleaceae bacterium]|nr:PTS sugar transporter subunit IIA [Defluviitaleaceae bacterium]